MGGYSAFSGPGARAARLGQRSNQVAEARRLLGVSEGATPEEIRAAFTRAVKDAHPDAGGQGGDIQQLKWARNLLLERRLPNENTAAIHPCPMCNGRGSVALGFGYERCTTCNGTGEV